MQNIYLYIAKGPRAAVIHNLCSQTGILEGVV